MPNKTPRPGQQHPDRWRDDLDPNALAGAAGPHPEIDARAAYDEKRVHRRLANLRDDELKQVPIIPAGSCLEQGATYIDLADDTPRELTATGDMTAGRDNCCVLKSAVDYTLWNRLIGVEEPDRLGAASDRG